MMSCQFFGTLYRYGSRFYRCCRFTACLFPRTWWWTTGFFAGERSESQHAGEQSLSNAELSHKLLVKSRFSSLWKLKNLEFQQKFREKTQNIDIPNPLTVEKRYHPAFHRPWRWKWWLGSGGFLEKPGSCFTRKGGPRDPEPTFFFQRII